MKKYNCGEEEIVNVTISKRYMPQVYEAKVRDYVNSGMSEDEARETVEGEVLVMEAYYEDGTGLFLVESEAVESCEIFSPYTREPLEEIEDDEDDEDDEPIEHNLGSSSDNRPDKSIFMFSADRYERESVEKFTFNECEHLSNADEDNVTKFDGYGLQDLLNDNLLDEDNCWFRVF